MENQIVPAVLKKHEGFLRRHLIVSSDIIEKLRIKCIITIFTESTLKQATADERITELLYILSRRSVRILAKFLEVLKESYDGWIAEKILGTDLSSLPIKMETGDKTLRSYLARLTSDNLFENKEPRREVAFHKKRRHRRIEIPLINSEPELPTQIVEVPYKVYSLHKVFEKQRLHNASALSALKQEQQAIHDILEQNQSEQQHLKKSQKAILDINFRLQAIHLEAGQLLQPGPTHGKIRNRLHHLMGIPRRNDSNFLDKV